MQGGASNSDIEELELALGDLTLTVRHRRAAASSPTSAVPLSNRVYIVLRSGCEPVSFYTTSYRRYFARLSDPVTGQLRSGTLSHGFASRPEAEAYCSAAGQTWPAKLLEQN